MSKAGRLGALLRDELRAALADFERDGDTASRTQLTVSDRTLSLMVMGDAATLRALLAALEGNE